MQKQKERDRLKRVGCAHFGKCFASPRIDSHVVCLVLPAQERVGQFPISSTIDGMERASVVRQLHKTDGETPHEAAVRPLVLNLDTREIDAQRIKGVLPANMGADQTNRPTTAASSSQASFAVSNSASSPNLNESFFTTMGRLVATCNSTAVDTEINLLLRINAFYRPRSQSPRPMSSPNKSPTHARIGSKEIIGGVSITHNSTRESDGNTVDILTLDTPEHSTVSHLSTRVPGGVAATSSWTDAEIEKYRREAGGDSSLHVDDSHEQALDLATSHKTRPASSPGRRSRSNSATLERLTKRPDSRGTYRPTTTLPRPPAQVARLRRASSSRHRRVGSNAETVPTGASAAAAAAAAAAAGGGPAAENARKAARHRLKTARSTTAAWGMGLRPATSQGSRRAPRHTTSSGFPLGLARPSTSGLRDPQKLADASIAAVVVAPVASLPSMGAPQPQTKGTSNKSSKSTQVARKVVRQPGGLW